MPAVLCNIKRVIEGGDSMHKVLSPGQFVAGVMAALTLKGYSEFKLNNTEIDEKFENAFKKLLEKSDQFGVIPDFYFERDRSHGDSASLRDTLISAKERKIIALNNPTLWTFENK